MFPPTDRRDIIRRVCPSCLSPKGSCKARDRCPYKAEREEWHTESLGTLSRRGQDGSLGTALTVPLNGHLLAVDRV